VEAIVAGLGEAVTDLDATICGLKSPHEAGHFLSQEISKDELQAAREREIEQLKDQEVFVLVKDSDYDNSHRRIGTVWVDKRTASDVVKSRICVQDFNNSKLEDTFSPTPGRSILFIIDLLADVFGFSTMVGDISGAFLHAAVPEGSTILVRPPPGFAPYGCLWLLRKMLYGLRHAPKSWSLHLRDVLMKMGCVASKREPSLYYHPHMRCHLLVHVDDLHGCGPEENIVALFAGLAKEVNLKYEGPFAEGSTYSYLKMLRKITVDGIYVTPDVAHIKSTAEQLGLL
jgi:hypothetical protein